MFRSAILLIGIAALGACSVLPERSAERAAPRQSQAVQISPEARACLTGLGDSRANFSPLPDKYYGAGCSTVNSVQLSAVRSDRASLALSNLGPVACPLAQDFAAWARFGVDRAAQQILGSPLVRIETMGSYSCRNVAGTTRRSAHSQANAIDVSAFVLEDGRRISLLAGWEGGTREEREFLRVIHKSACKRFGTVLGPDYNAAHRDHFHLEGSGGGYCR